MKRGLSGYWFRHKSDDGSWENMCFEDLPEDRQREILATQSTEWKDRMILGLSAVIKRIGDELDIITEAKQ